MNHRSANLQDAQYYSPSSYNYLEFLLSPFNVFVKQGFRLCHFKTTLQYLERVVTMTDSPWFCTKEQMQHLSSTNARRKIWGITGQTTLPQLLEIISSWKQFPGKRKKNSVWKLIAQTSCGEIILYHEVSLCLIPPVCFLQACSWVCQLHPQSDIIQKPDEDALCVFCQLFFFFKREILHRIGPKIDP